MGLLSERRLALPAWCSLTDEEIVAAIALLSQRKREGGGFSLVEGEAPEWYTLKVPINCALRREDIITVLNVANRAATEKHADAVLKFQDGVVVTKNIMLKPNAIDGGNQLRISGPPHRF